MAEDRVQATPEALDVIERLTAEHGPLVFLQSGGCCDGSSPLCVRRSDLSIGPGDVLLGDVGPASFYVDRELDERWGKPRYVIDVSPGAGDTFSLEGREDLHFVIQGWPSPSSTGAAPQPPVWKSRRMRMTRTIPAIAQTTVWRGPVRPPATIAAPGMTPTASTP